MSTRVCVTVQQPVSAEIGEADVIGYLTEKGWKPLDLGGPEWWRYFADPSGDRSVTVSHTPPDRSPPALRLAMAVEDIAEIERRSPAEVLHEIEALIARRAAPVAA